MSGQTIETNKPAVGQAVLLRGDDAFAEDTPYIVFSHADPAPGIEVWVAREMPQNAEHRFDPAPAGTLDAYLNDSTMYVYGDTQWAPAREAS